VDAPRVLALQVGDAYADVYVDRLFRGLQRHLSPEPRLTLYTDRTRPVDPAITQEDASGWGLKGYFNKLRLFDPGLTGPEPFLYLDLTLVIRGSLAPFLRVARESGASLLGVRDWNYPILNSCVLWVRPDRFTGRVWKDFKEGRRYLEHVAGDQNYIDAVFRTHFPQALEFWPEGMVASYKTLRKEAARDPEAAYARYRASTILKFHGHPKPHEVLRPWLRPSATILRHPLKPGLWRYLASELHQHWA
jgi:hypothetical protein